MFVFVKILYICSFVGIFPQLKWEGDGVKDWVRDVYMTPETALEWREVWDVRTSFPSGLGFGKSGETEIVSRCAEFLMLRQGAS